MAPFETFIAILRGINVSGQKKIKMQDLKTLFESLGFKDVQTYIQSGNVIFKTQENDQLLIASQIEKTIENTFSFKVPIIIISVKEMEQVVGKNPFVQRKEDTTRLYVTFLAESPQKENIEKLSAYHFPPEEYALDDRCLYFFSPNGYGKAKMNNNFFEQKLKVTATTRNWKTVNTLYEMAQN